MERSTREIEIKLPYPSASVAREALDRLGAVRVSPRAFEDNVVFDRDDDALARADCLLRVRTKGGRSTVTLKTPVAGTHRHKVRMEHETSVGDPDAMTSLFAGLGFKPRWRYQKYRTVYAAGGLEISLDETPLGCFVELEGPSEAIDAVARQLGFTEDGYIRCSYRDLQEHEAERRGVPLGDLLLEPARDARA
jgi:adenylate cyclase class 2